MLLIEAKKDRFLHSIQALRGVAVLMVVFYHVYIIGGDSNYLGYAVFKGFSEPGKFGVNLFFVLSGFIIFHAHSVDIGRPSQLGSYFYKRFSRIYPVYWFFLFGYVFAAYLGLGHADFSWEAGNLISSMFLWGGYPELSLPLKVAWTLCYELIFYALFMAFLISARLGVILFFLWLVTLIVLNVLIDGAIGYRVFEVWNLNFILGGVCYYVFNNLSKVRLDILIVMFALFVAGLLYSSFSMDFSETPLSASNKHIMILLSLAFSCLVMCSLLLNDFFKSRFLSWLVKLGNASYSVYLTHSAWISLYYIALRKLGLLSQVYEYGVVIYISAVLTSLLVGYIAFIVVEKPLVKVCRNIYSERLEKRNCNAA